MTSKSSRVVEDYLTLVYKAHEWPGGRASTSELAEQLGVTRSTVSANLKRLASAGFIDYEPYGEFRLTNDGEAIAVNVVRRHRIIESYLCNALGLNWEDVHAEADTLEHAVSDRLLDRMDEAAGRPALDPHGDPIPRKGQMRSTPDTVDLASLPVDARCRVIRVSDRFSDVLRYLRECGLVLGAELQVRQALDDGGLMRVQVAERSDSVILSAVAASSVRVALNE